MEKRYMVIISFAFLFLLAALLVWANHPGSGCTFPSQGKNNWGGSLHCAWNEKHNDDGTFKDNIIGAAEPATAEDSIIDGTVDAEDLAPDSVAGSELALVNAFVFGSIDDAAPPNSGWVPDDAVVAFTITENAASVTADSVILVSLDGSAGDVCAVSDVTDATNFKVDCTTAPNNDATLNYVIWDQG